MIGMQRGEDSNEREAFSFDCREGVAGCLPGIDVSGMRRDHTHNLSIQYRQLSASQVAVDLFRQANGVTLIPAPGDW
jgi:hypothetical protein